MDRNRLNLSPEARALAVELGEQTHWSAATWGPAVEEALALGLTRQDIYGAMSPRVLWWAIDWATSKIWADDPGPSDDRRARAKPLG